jgi:hypothetical protein
MDPPIRLPDSLERRLCAAENKIKCLEESTHAMKVYWNTLVPILRLPTEILSTIFSLLSSFEALNLEPSPPVSSIHVSHVCQWQTATKGVSELQSWTAAPFSQK